MTKRERLQKRYNKAYSEYQAAREFEQYLHEMDETPDQKHWKKANKRMAALGAKLDSLEIDLKYTN